MKFHPIKMAAKIYIVKVESLWKLGSLPTSTMPISQLLFTYFLSVPTFFGVKPTSPKLAFKIDR
jgi:hypothetical protein